MPSVCSAHAMFARRHMHDHGTTRAQLTSVAVKNHHYGAQNPLAMFRKPVTAEKAEASESVASPLNVYDCCANADGAASGGRCASPRCR